MAADTITIPRETAFEAAAFLDAVAFMLGDLGADTNKLFEIQGKSYDPIAAMLEKDSSVEENARIDARSRAIKRKLFSLVDLDLVRRVVAYERKLDELDLRLSLIEKRDRA